MTAVITAPVVFGDGDIATNKTIIDSFKKDLQKEDGLSPEERQRYNLLYTEFVNDLSSSIDRAEKNGESEKRIKRHKKILSKRIKILDELPT